MYPGVDIIEIDRFAQAYSRHHKIAGRLFLAEELAELQGKSIQSWAGRFAAKEAVLKALGQGIGKLSWHDIRIISNESGEPVVYLSERGMETARLRGGSRVKVSISHNRSQAIALAILE